MSNRVEDLERQVAELQAAVNGLTEELVEMKERVRQLEDERSVAVDEAAAGQEGSAASAAAGESSVDEPAAADTADEAWGGERTTHSDDHVDVIEPTGEPDADATDGDEMVVPEQSATTPDAETGPDAAGDENADDGESSEGDDIIVA
jgi:TolA-binding protein